MIAGAGLAAGLGLLATQPSVRAADTITFSEHVAPIVYAHCASCHRPGEAAPFSLLTYADVKQRATLIARLTASRRMPPWKAGPGDYEFRKDRKSVV